MFAPLVSMKTLWYKYKKVFEFTELTYKSMQPLKWVEYIEIDATVYVSISYKARPLMKFCVRP